jgi:hypothetical protein
MRERLGKNHCRSRMSLRSIRATACYRYARQARLVDGADEVHKMVLARHMREEGRDFWKWGVGL